MRDSLSTRVATATADAPDCTVVTDDAARVILAAAGRTVGGLARQFPGLTTADDRADIRGTGAALAVVRVARAIASGQPIDAALAARESTRAAWVDYRGDALSSREVTAALDWTGDDGDVRASLTAQVPAADAHLTYGRRDALADALDDGDDYRPGEDDGPPPAVIVRRMLAVLPGHDRRAWPNGLPAVAPVADSFGMARKGRQSQVAARRLADALAVIGTATREHMSGHADADRAARWTPTAVVWSDAARDRMASDAPVGPHGPITYRGRTYTPAATAATAERFAGTASAVVTRYDGPAVGSVATGRMASWSIVTIGQGDDRRPATPADVAATLATPDADARPVTDRAADRAAMALAPMGAVAAPSSRKSKRGGGVGGSTLPAGWTASWAEKRA